MVSQELSEKHACLEQRLAALGSAAVAFSAGVDSTLLLAVTHRVLGENAIAFTAASPAHPQAETQAARAFCAQHGIRQVVMETDELALNGFVNNPPDRCYICKRHFFELFRTRAAEMGLACVVEGSNVDDLGDYRPGRRALGELAVESPLLDCGFSKQDVRDLSRELGLPTWDKPALPCLYTRFAYGEELAPAKLHRVEEAERFLAGLGFATVRVRVQDGTARVELAPADIPRAAADPLRSTIAGELRRLGFAYAALDLQGYRTGSMNEML